MNDDNIQIGDLIGGLFSALSDDKFIKELDEKKLNININLEPSELFSKDIKNKNANGKDDEDDNNQDSESESESSEDESNVEPSNDDKLSVTI